MKKSAHKITGATKAPVVMTTDYTVTAVQEFKGLHLEPATKRHNGVSVPIFGFKCDLIQY